MGGYYWEQIVMMLLDKIENMKAHEDEMNQEINRLMEENVRLNQVLKRRSEMIMIGDMLNNNKRRDVKTRMDQQMYLGKKYRQDKKTGYYVCTSGDRKRLHVAMWEAEAGVAVPPGCVIHHVDWVKTHNEIFNLVCVTVSEHERIHNTPGGREFGIKLKKERGVGLPPGVEIEAGS